MVSKVNKNAMRLKRHVRVRGKISGTPERPRLNVFRSNTNIYAQIIDDVNGVTLASANTLEKEFEGLTGNCEGAKKVGAVLAERAKAKGISELTGTCTAQSGTIWYTDCLPQVEGAQIMAQSESAPAMIMAVESGTVDFICTDMPTAMGACATYSDLAILDFSDTEDNFKVDEGQINIGISVVKGNTELKDAMDKVLAPLNADIFNAIMNQAIAVQPTI